MADTDTRRVYLKNVRLSYPHLTKKQKANEDAEPRFSASFLIDPTTPEGKINIKKIKKAVAAAKEEAGFSEKTRFKEGRMCFFDGNDNVDDEGEVKLGYEDMMVIKASNKDAVQLFTRARKAVDVENSPFYGGCYVECKLGLFGTTKGGSPGIFASLDGVRFWDDGDPFGRAAIGEDDWDEDEEDDDLLD
jgi:hypothetical protein